MFTFNIYINYHRNRTYLGAVRAVDFAGAEQQAVERWGKQVYDIRMCM